MSTSLMIQTIDDKDYIFCRMCKKFKGIEDYHIDDDFVYQFCGDCLADDHKTEFDDFMYCVKLVESLRNDEESLSELRNNHIELFEKIEKIHSSLAKYFQ